jgi:anti-sigma regulatory factor (Ser/Thr protein kinase)
MALVELLLSPLPSHVRTARLVVLAAARRAGLEDGLVDELRLAVSEACSRAVGLNARHAAEVPVKVLVSDDPSGLTLSVTDAGPAAGPAVDDLSEGLLAGPEDADDMADPDVALGVLTGLVDDVAVEPGATGTTVTMRWPLPVGASGPGATAVSQA